MKEELKPLPKEVTDEIRAILEGCQNGTLKHNQEEIHCGTAHCIAGWKSVFDYAKLKRSKSVLNADFDSETWLDKMDDFIRERGFIFETAYAQEAWELTTNEARRLFHESATLPEQFALLEKFERGERIP